MIRDLNLKATPSCIVEELIQQYGYDITLGKLLIELTRDKGYRCPKCEGKGFVTIKTPDIYGSEGCVKDIKCDLCKGTGFTDKRMKPRMVQDGWEEV
jgi:DNA-directed RNA polymerase subunit RPC12/RpoP